MKKYVGIVVVVIIALSMSVMWLSGCIDARNDEEKIIGFWDRVDNDFDQIWEFTPDGEILITGSNVTMNYTFIDGFLITIIQTIEYVDKYEYRFDGSDKLVLNLVAGGGAIDHETGEIINLQDAPFITELRFERISL